MAWLVFCLNCLKNELFVRGIWSFVSYSVILCEGRVLLLGEIVIPSCVLSGRENRRR